MTRKIMVAGTLACGTTMSGKILGGKILRWLLYLASLMALAAACASAQTTDPNFVVRCVADPAKVAKALADASAGNKQPEITGTKVCAASQMARMATGASDTEYTFNSEITLVVEHDDEQSFDEIGQPNPGDLVLFLDGKALHGTHPMVGASAMDVDSVTSTLLTYRITHDVSTPAAQSNWTEILTGSKSQKVLSVSTGEETGGAAKSEATILFTSISTGRAFLFAAVAIVVLAVFFLFAKKTGALRDSEPAPPGFPADQRAYSLSRCQMAAWTVLVVLAYLFIWLLTGQYNATIPGAIVALMGISAGTFGLAAAVDTSKANSAAEKIAQMKSAKSSAATADDIATLEKRAQVCPSENIARDLVTSDKGASLHRLQMLVWTLALMVVFVVTVWTTLALPAFSDTLLALMGISSGAYVGMKLPENKT